MSAVGRGLEPPGGLDAQSLPLHRDCKPPCDCSAGAGFPQSGAQSWSPAATFACKGMPERPAVSARPFAGGESTSYEALGVEAAASDAHWEPHGMRSHEGVLHLRLLAKYAAAFFTMASSSACSASRSAGKHGCLTVRQSYLTPTRAAKASALSL